MKRDRQKLLNKVKKKKNAELIKEKMANTFSHQRLEVVSDSPTAADFKERWPALFCESEVGESIKPLTFHLLY